MPASALSFDLITAGRRGLGGGVKREGKFESRRDEFVTLSQLQLSALVDGLYDVANNPHVGFKTAPAPPLPPVLLPHSLHCLQTAIAANLSSWEQKLVQVEAFALSLSAI